MLKIKLFKILACISIIFGKVLPSTPWETLLQGNKKFIKDNVHNKSRAKYSNHQEPCCIVLTGSDSRVSPEAIFQQGIGTMFTVRVAGNVVDDVVIDTIEYAVTHFKSTTLIVMGHTNCGAVIGALKRLKTNKGKVVVPANKNHLNAVLLPIEKAIKAVRIDINSTNALELATKANINYAAQQLLLKSKHIKKAVKTGKIKLIKAEYNVSTGVVATLPK
ncbi:MAG: carbonic anhydrase [Candidatus Babeliales bacterium]|nr:carbonic anhydrase [Candidatus Babeliales bacterium]